jgi:hypothetical protein
VNAANLSKVVFNMFYPVMLDIDEDESRIDRATVVLNPAASKRLIGKAVAALPEVQDAFLRGRLSISTGSTCKFVVEELTGEKVEPYRYCVGMIADGMLSSSLPEDRDVPRFLVKGELQKMDALKFFDTFEKGDVVIKGGNAVDPEGNAGVIAANNQGGTIGGILSFLSVRGIPLIMPIGLEKSIASVIDASGGWGQLTQSKTMGLDIWLYPVTCGLVVTEIEALGILAGVAVRHVASGGIAGSEGAVVLLIEGSKKNVAKAWDIVQSVKDEPAIEVPRHKFS